MLNPTNAATLPIPLHIRRVKKHKAEPRRNRFCTYEEAKETATRLNIRNCREYFARYNEHPELKLPRRPDCVYKGVWKDWNSFLQSNFCTYEEAVAEVRRLGIHTAKEYTARRKESLYALPLSPNVVYIDNWDGWKKFLGSKYCTYKEAKTAVLALGIKNQRDYTARRSESTVFTLPSRPDVTYESEWNGWRIFLGKTRRES